MQQYVFGIKCFTMQIFYSSYNTFYTMITNNLKVYIERPRVSIHLIRNKDHGTESFLRS